MATTNGVDQTVINQLQLNGQRSFENDLFNTNTVDFSSSYQFQPNNVTPLQLTAQNAPNTSTQNLALTNQFAQVAANTYNNQNQLIADQANQQVQNLQNQAQIANYNNLRLFGTSGFVDPTKSSRNLSYATNTKATLDQQLGNITNQALSLINQNLANYSQNNLNVLQTARTLDQQDRQINQQDRQLNLSEALQRGQEQGVVFDYDPATNTVKIQRDQNGNAVLNLQGKQFEDNIKNSALSRNSEKIRQSISLSNLTGKLPTFEGLTNDNSVYNPTLQNNVYTQQGEANATANQLNQLGLPVAQYQAALASEMINQELFKTQTQAQKSALESQIALQPLQNASLQSEFTATIAKNNELIKNLANGSSNDNSNAVNTLDNIGNQILNATNPNQKQALLEQYNNLKDSLFTRDGSGIGVYYDKVATKKDDLGRVTNYEYSTKKDDKGRAISDTLARFGYDGNLDFRSSDNQESLDKIRNDLQTQFEDGIKAGDTIEKGINKFFFTDPKTDNTLLAYATTDKDGNRTGYKYWELNLSNLNPDQKVALTKAIKEGVNPETGKQMPANNVKGLQELDTVLQKYSSNSSVSEIAFPEAFINRVDQYGVGDNKVFGGYTNKQVLRASALGGNRAGLNMLKDDSYLQNFDANLTLFNRSVNNIESQLKSQGIQTGLKAINTNDLVNAIRKGSGELTTQVGNNRITLSLNDLPEKKFIDQLSNWYKTYNEKGQAYLGTTNLNALLNTSPEKIKANDDVFNILTKVLSA